MRTNEQIVKKNLENKTLFESYLKILGLTKRTPHLIDLTDIVGAHLKRIPFENLSKIYYNKFFGISSLPDLETFLHGIVKYHFGGTCYANNYYLYQLLKYIGYDVKLCGADMTNPDVHIAMIVNCDDNEYLVDVGYGAPFYAPMPLNLTIDHSIPFGRDTYTLKPVDENGFSRMIHTRGKEFKHEYKLKPKPRKIDEFEEIINASYADDAHFMNSINMTRFHHNKSVSIHNFDLIITEGNKSEVFPLRNRQRIIASIEKYFAIPEALVERTFTKMGKFQLTEDK